MYLFTNTNVRKIGKSLMFLPSSDPPCHCSFQGAARASVIVCRCGGYRASRAQGFRCCIVHEARHMQVIMFAKSCPRYF
uniref:Uncharacterized protein n=1 Tax=Arundo donax TaxID=35708 RepID=A0A0A9HPL1_ARUDO